MTQDQARAIAEAHHIQDILDDDQEFAFLREHNPDLIAAYQVLLFIASGESES